MEFIARVNPRYFAAINLFAADQDVRYYLCGVYIEPHPEKGAIIVATNGHVMGMIHDPDGFCAQPIIVGDISKQLISACVSKGVIKGLPPTGLYITDGGAIVEYGDVQEKAIEPFGKTVMHLSRIQIVDGKFPDWRRVIPKKTEPSGEVMVAQAQYLSLFEKVVKALGAQRTYSGVTMELVNGRSIIARLQGVDLADRFAAIVMQLHGGDKQKPYLPEWLMPKDEPQADQATA